MASCEQVDEADYEYEDYDDEEEVDDQDDDLSASDNDYEVESGWELAARGVRLALNNRVEEAERLLRGRAEAPAGLDPDGGRLQAQAGLSFLTFMNAVMTFEEEKMLQSLQTLRATERSCSSYSSTAAASTMTASPSLSTIQGMRSRFHGLMSNSFKRGLSQQQVSCDASIKLEQQIVAADCQVLEAVLAFLHQDWSSCMKGAWVLRKAWKIYQRTYGHIRGLYMREIGLRENSLAPPPPTSGPQTSPSPSSPPPTPAAVPTTTTTTATTTSTRKKTPIRRGVSHSLSVPFGLLSLVGAKPSSTSSSGASSEASSPASEEASSNSASECSSSPSSSKSTASSSGTSSIPAETVRRLMAAVSFGYGIFHLAVSLLPPKVAGVVHFLGFEGDRQTGIRALHFARQGGDMRGPVATLALLWYHTIVRPFYGLDGSNLQSGADAAQRLIDSSKPDFSNSALFLFFQGRVDRLKSNFASALSSYEMALQASAQREVRLLCLHEVGWSHVLLLRWPEAADAFLALRAESRWSKSFYSYLSSVCVGSSGDVSGCLELAQETPRLVRSKSAAGGNNQLERFLQRRASKMQTDCPKDQRCQDYCLLLAYELLYLWNALGACLKHSHAAIQIDCERISVPALEMVRQLILGSVYANLGRMAQAQQSYRRAIDLGRRQQEDGAAAEGGVGDGHAAAFAAYELGLLLCRRPETRSDGRSYLCLARDNYRGYDFENRLTVRIHAALRYHSEDSGVRMAQALISN